MARILRYLRTTLAVIGCLWLVIVFTPLVWWWAGRLAQPWGSGKGDVLIVLSADNSNDNIIGLSSYWRAVYTVRAMREHKYRRVIISGGAPSGVSLAELMREFVHAHGIDTSNVWLETAANSTVDNAVFSANLLRGDPGGKIILLTSDYHVWRAVRVFRKAGLDVDPLPVPDVLKRSGAWYERPGLFVDRKSVV